MNPKTPKSKPGQLGSGVPGTGGKGTAPSGHHWSVSFDLTINDIRLVRTIANKVKKHFRRPLIEIEMDLAATHANGCPLRLQGMASPDANMNTVLHDVIGISKHLNRRTGKLENHFLPKFACREE